MSDPPRRKRQRQIEVIADGVTKSIDVRRADAGPLNLPLSGQRRREMPKPSDLGPLDEFDPETAQALLGDSPTFRRTQGEIVASLRQRIQESGNQTMIARLPALDEAYEAYRADPAWVGPSFARLLEANDRCCGFQA